MKDKILNFVKCKNKAHYKNQEISSTAHQQIIHAALSHHINFLN
jgi:hypothetical protein